MNQLVFYIPGSTGFVDIAINVDGVVLSSLSRETHDQLALRYPGVVVGNMDDVLANQKMQEASFKSQPVEITEDRYIKAMEVLPPFGLVSRWNEESFKMYNLIYGNITEIYLRIGKRYFCFKDEFSMRHDEIVAKINAVFYQEVECG